MRLISYPHPRLTLFKLVCEINQCDWEPIMFVNDKPTVFICKICGEQKGLE